MSGFDVQKIRGDFPQLTKRHNGKHLVYLDSAATALKPWPVIERISHFNSYEVANVHRGAHLIADQGTKAFESTREKIAGFFNISSTDEIIFTKGTTESINLVAQSWGRANLKANDIVLVSEMEHHANIVPWQMICQETGAKVKKIALTDEGELDISDLEKSLKNAQVKMVAVAHCSNVLGTINDIQKITKLSHAAGAKVLTDGAQMVASSKVDIQNLNCDFYVFSAHKMFGPYGVGVLFGKKEILQSMPPYQGGGSMISKVDFEGTTYNDLPYKFEAGTPNISGVIAFASALDYLIKIGWSAISEYEAELKNYTLEKLSSVDSLKILGPHRNRGPLFSFTLKGLHHSDVAQILDQQNIAVRAGHHCAQPLLKRFGISGSVRASLSIYNQKSEVDLLIQGILKAKEVLND